MDKHVTAVGMVFIFFGAQGVFIALMLLTALFGVGFLSGIAETTRIPNIIGFAVVGPFLLLEAAKIVGGIALLKRRSWARILVLVLSFLSIIHFPIGTAYSFYAIWVLMKDDTVRLLATGADAQ